MQAIILAGGLGTRLAEETDRIPKPMVKVGPQPMLWHIMKIYSAFGITDFTITAGYLGHIIKDWVLGLHSTGGSFTLDVDSGSIERHGDSRNEKWKVTVLETGEFSHTAERLRLAMAELPGQRVVATYGDGLANINITDLLQFHSEHGKLATVTAVRPPARFGRLSIEGGSVKKFGEKDDALEDFVNGGFFVFEPDVIEFLNSDEPFEGGPISNLVESQQLMAYRHTGFWQPMDTLREQRHLDSLWKSGNAPWAKWW